MDRLRGEVATLQGEVTALNAANAELKQQQAAGAVSAPQAGHASGVKTTPARAPPQLRTRTELRLLVESGWGDEEVVVAEILAEGTPVEEEEGDEEAELALLGSPQEGGDRSELEARVAQLTAQLSEEKARSASMLGEAPVSATA